LADKPRCDGERLALSVAPKDAGCKYEERPEPCRRCGSAPWWNGWRTIKHEVLRDASGAVIERAARRHRARCSGGDRSCRDWTVYSAEAYPYRTYQLSLVSAAVEAVALGGATRTAAGAQHHTTRRSVSRWLGWVGSLVEAGDLARLCARLDAQGRRPPFGTAAAGPQSTTVRRAGVVLRLLDHLADLLRERGALGARHGPALGEILARPLERFGEVAFLTRGSPRLRVAAAFAPG
jgi:hypothetical protein